VKNVSCPSSEKLRVATEECSAYKAHDYGNLRKMFIQDAMENRGIGAREAAQEWNVSSQKRKMLAGLSVPELRRRRFLKKGETENPWAIAESF